MMTPEQEAAFWRMKYLELYGQMVKQMLHDAQVMGALTGSVSAVASPPVQPASGGQNGATAQAHAEQ